MASIKGKLFEFFVYRLLVSCGFKPVTPDGLLVYTSGAGLMVQGMGQPHNADVLLSPPIQTPFYYPTRMLVECKCYSAPIGLPQIRSALGLREDINNFEIVTEDILRSRKHARCGRPKFHDMKRYVYQVAVASVDGFKSTAYPFAKAHRIPLLSFADSMLFSEIRRAISALDSFAEENEEAGRRISEHIGDIMILHPEQRTYIDRFDCKEWREYIAEIENLEKQVTVALLDNGTILFLLHADEHDENSHAAEHDGTCTLHWCGKDDSTWVLAHNGTSYYFELPKELYDDWKRSVGEQRKDALRLKREYFSKVVLFHGGVTGSEEITVLRLSEEFMRNAERSVSDQNDN